MPVRHAIDVDAGLIMVYLSGAVTAPEILANYARIAVDPTLRPGLVVLADCRDVDAVPTFPEISIVATAQAHSPPALRPTRAAVVVATAWLFGIVRQFGALAERTGVRVMPFYSYDDARRWLTDEARAAFVQNDATNVS